MLDITFSLCGASCVVEIRAGSGREEGIIGYVGRVSMLDMGCGL